jgi:hypothetical protein
LSPAVRLNHTGKEAWGYLGNSAPNPGEMMRNLARPDLPADIVIPVHDPELLNMRIIPDVYHLEEL